MVKVKKLGSPPKNRDLGAGSSGGKKETASQTKKDMKKDKGKEGVTDVDRKKHKEIAKEIKERMNKPLPQKPKTFEEFYKVKEKACQAFREDVSEAVEEEGEVVYCLK